MSVILSFCLHPFPDPVLSSEPHGSIYTQGKDSKKDQKDLLNLPLCKVMNCYINCSHCEGQNLTEFQSGRLA